jgi:hypothetical protein
MTKRITVDLYTEDDMVTYVGRCLGFVNSKQFALIVSDSGARNRLSTGATISLEDLTSVKSVTGLRLCIDINKSNGNTVLTRKLFVTEPLDYIQQARMSSDGERAISFMSINENYLMVTEEK